MREYKTDTAERHKRELLEHKRRYYAILISQGTNDTCVTIRGADASDSTSGKTLEDKKKCLNFHTKSMKWVYFHDIWLRDEEEAKQCRRDIHDDAHEIFKAVRLAGSSTPVIHLQGFVFSEDCGISGKLIGDAVINAQYSQNEYQVTIIRCHWSGSTR